MSAPTIGGTMYHVYRQATIKNTSSGKTYTITMRKWDMPVSPYEVVYDMENTDNDYNPGTYNVYEYMTFDDAHAMFMQWIDTALCATARRITEHSRIRGALMRSPFFGKNYGDFVDFSWRKCGDFVEDP